MTQQALDYKSRVKIYTTFTSSHTNIDNHNMRYVILNSNTKPIRWKHYFILEISSDMAIIAEFCFMLYVFNFLYHSDVPSIFLLYVKYLSWVVVAHAFNSSTWEAEAGRFLILSPSWSTKWVLWQPDNKTSFFFSFDFFWL